MFAVHVALSSDANPVSVINSTSHFTQGKNAIFTKRQSRMSLKKSDVKQRLEEVILGTSSARSNMIQRHSRQGSLTG
jgi:hypothetical protein